MMGMWKPRWVVAHCCAGDARCSRFPHEGADPHLYVHLARRFLAFWKGSGPIVVPHLAAAYCTFGFQGNHPHYQGVVDCLANDAGYGGHGEEGNVGGGDDVGGDDGEGKAGGGSDQGVGDGEGGDGDGGGDEKEEEGGYSPCKGPFYKMNTITFDKKHSM